MRCRRQLLLAVASLAAAGLFGLGAFVASGLYNIGADDHHTALVLALLTHLRERSIALRATRLAVPDLEDNGRVSAGGRAYATLCVGCHLAPGVTHSPLRAGLYPHPPNLGEEQPRDARRAFWVIKHGIKMSAMPAWGRSLDDPAIWDLVAFLERLPQMSPEAYHRAVQ